MLEQGLAGYGYIFNHKQRQKKGPCRPMLKELIVNIGTIKTSLGNKGIALLKTPDT